MNHFKSLISTVLLLASFFPITAQVSNQNTQIPVEFYNQLEWRNIGPLRGGRSLGVAGSPGRINEYYFGATGGGLWKTDDGGTVCRNLHADNHAQKGNNQPGGKR